MEPLAPVVVGGFVLIMITLLYVYVAIGKLDSCLKRLNDVLNACNGCTNQTTYETMRVGKELLEIKRMLEQVPKSVNEQAAARCLKEIHELTINHYLKPESTDGTREHQV